MFGSPKTTFGGPVSTAFGQSTSLFGASAAKPVTNLFGQTSVGSAVAPGNVAAGAVSTTLPLFGGAQSQQQSALGWTGSTVATGLAAANGTHIAFNPPIVTDTVARNGQMSQVNVKHMCITAMKEYQDKSLEELRLEDYALNRRTATVSTSTVGTTSLFGTSSAASLANKPFQFNSPQTNPGVGSLFGQPAKPANTLFGGGTSATGGGLLFGAATNTATQSVFGQTAQTHAAPIFGTTPLFGSAASTTAPAGTNLFGAGTAASTGFAFGQQQQPTAGIFGVQATTKPATLFGAVQPTPSNALGFGANTGSSLFSLNKTTNAVVGANPTALFGTAGVAAQQPAATGFGFGSLKPGTSAGTGLFGATTSTSAGIKPGGLFGATPGTSTGFGFGVTQPLAFSGFGTPAVATATTNTLGAASATGGLFGQANAKKAFAFGQPIGASNVAATTAVGAGLFGQPAAAPAASGLSLFGTPAATGNLGFGTSFGVGNTGATPSLFGTGGSVFGLGQKPAAAGFGSSVATGFGTATQGVGTGLFGSTSGVGLGTGGLYAGTTSALGLGGFGMQPTFAPAGSGLTASSATEQLAQSVRIQQQVLELVRSMPYGQSPLFRYINLPTEATTGSTTTTSTIFGSGVTDTLTTKADKSAAAVAPVKAVVSALAERHRSAGISLGLSPISSPTKAISGGRNMLMTSRNPTVTQRLLQISNRSKLFSGFYDDNDAVSPNINNKSARGTFGTCRSTTFGGERSAVTNGLTNLAAEDSPGSFFVRRDEWRRLRLPDNVRTSILERSAASSREFSQLAEASLATDATNDQDTATQVGPPGGGDATNTPRKPPPTKDTGGDAVAGGDGSVSVPSSMALASPTTNRIISPSRASSEHQRVTTASTISIPSSSVCLPRTAPIGITAAHEALRQQSADDSVCLEDLDSTWTANATIADLDASKSLSPSQPSTEQSQPTPKCGVRLSKPGYYILPNIEELNKLVDVDGRCIVENFVVGRQHYGHILFPSNTDVTGLNLDDIVHIRRREVVVYPDDEKKPPVGCGLNRSAEVCLEAIWPTDKSTREPIKSSERLSIMRFDERLERATRRMDAKFIEYRPESGSWVFEVKHFSKYRLDESDEETEADHRDVRATQPQTEPGGAKLTWLPPISDSMVLSDDELYSTTVVTEGLTDGLTHSAPHKEAHPPTIVPSQDANPSNFKEQESFEISEDMPNFQQCAEKLPMSLTFGDAARNIGISPAALRQMRSALFSQTATRSNQLIDGHFGVSRLPATVDNRFGISHSDCADDFDFCDELVGQAKTNSRLTNTWLTPVGEKRLFNERAGSAEFWRAYPDLAGTVYIKNDVQLHPTPNKIQCFAPTKMVPSSSEQKVYSQSVTPFRPLPRGNAPAGLPVRHGTAHLYDFRTVRLPSYVKHLGSQVPYDNSDLAKVQCSAGLYPYALIAKLWPRDLASVKYKLDSKLSHLFLDMSIWRGHGLRPFWGLLRTDSLHRLILLTSGILTPGPVSVSTPWLTVSGDILASADTPSSGFIVSLNTWSPPVVEVADEDLLNTALATSKCNFPETTAFSAGTDALLANQHSRQQCSFWQPVQGLLPLESAARLLGCFQFTDHVKTTLHRAKEEESAHLVAIRRVVALCQCLWGRHPQELLRPKSMGDTEVRVDRIEENDDEEDRSTCVADVSSLEQEEEVENHRSNDNSRRFQLPAVAALSRKQAVSEWIRVQSFPWLESRLRQLGLWSLVGDSIISSLSSVNQRASVTTYHRAADVTETSATEGIFACLVAGEPGLACRLALRAGLARLATLLAQCSAGDPLVRRGLQRQLTLWQQTEHDQHIPQAVLRIYTLLAGQGHYSHSKKPIVISVVDGLDWIRVLGVYLWYLTDYSATLSEVLRTYSMHWHQASQCKTGENAVLSIARPLPPTVTDLSAPPICRLRAVDFPDHSNDCSAFSSNRSWPRDMAYHLLQLYCSRAHSLERTLEPTGLLVYRDSVGQPSCLADPAGLLDWSASWYLWRQLFALGYRHLSTGPAAHLCTEFASQLEDAGLWEWAVFVLLHIADRVTREVSVKAMLGRHASLVLSEQWAHDAVGGKKQGLVPAPRLTKAEHFVVERLGVPVRWLYEAKAILAQHRRLRSLCFRKPELDCLSLQPSHTASRGRIRLQVRLFAMLEASSWLAAGHFAAAHTVCVDYLLPDLMLHTGLLSQVSCSSSSIPLSLRLSDQLNRLLEQFTSLPASERPPDFSTGAEIYLKYSNILRLADELARLYQREPAESNNLDELTNGRAITPPLVPDGGDMLSEEDLGVDSQDRRLNFIIGRISEELTSLTQQLQHMPVKSLTNKVIQTEMSSTCAQLISAFLSTDDLMSCGEQQQQLIAMTAMGLPVDYRLRELRRLAEVRLAVPGAF